MKIIFEDKNIIVVEKAPGETSQPDKKQTESLMSMIKAHMDAHGEKKKNPYLIHRLDRPVGGLMVYAKTKESAADLSKQVQNNRIRKKYYAVVMGKLDAAEGELNHYLLKHEPSNTSRVVSSDTAGAKEAILKYRVLEEIQTENGEVLSLIEVLLITGRHHQIRVQFSEIGHAIWGDTKYNPQFSENAKWVAIALFSGLISFVHPSTSKPVKYTSAPDSEAMPWSLFKYFKNDSPMA